MRQFGPVPSCYSYAIYALQVCGRRQINRALALLFCCLRQHRAGPLSRNPISHSFVPHYLDIFSNYKTYTFLVSLGQTLYKFVLVPHVIESVGYRVN